MSTSRTQKIRSIIEARRPMADRASEADQTLDKIDRHLREFRKFIHDYAAKLDSDASARVSSLLPEVDDIISKIGQEKTKLALLSSRFSRTTLNIGVVGRAGQGKSTLLQQITGLGVEVIPSGGGTHCTGAPSFAVNHDAAETSADIECHTERSFLQDVIAPFFQELSLGPSPQSLGEFEKGFLGLVKNAQGDTTKAHQLERLGEFHSQLSAYRHLLTGERYRIEGPDIRSYIAQTDSSERKIWNWPAIKVATIYCRFPQSDVGALGIADTPGLGDFISGAEERLVSTVGNGLDAVLFVRRPPADRQIIDPQDTHLYSLIQKAIPDLPLSGWSYFIANEDAQNASRIGVFINDVLGNSHIKTRKSVRANCVDSADVARCLDEILNDVASNLGALDLQLFAAREAGLKSLASSISALVDRAGKALPKAVALPDRALVKREFNRIWTELAYKLESTVMEYGNVRGSAAEGFLEKVGEIFGKLEELDKIEGPLLPPAETIVTEAAGPGLPIWHSNKLHAMRVYLSKAFEELDSFFNVSFDQLRADLVRDLADAEGGNLGFLARDADADFWKELSQAWEDQEENEKGKVQHAIERLLTAGLSFRGFIQPRVRECLDVLDSTTPAASDFAYQPNDNAARVREKLTLAWEKACYLCRQQIETPASEVAMALFAAAEDFVDALLREGGHDAAKDRWELFYDSNRNDIWPEKFADLEADTRLRRQWEKQVNDLKEAARSLG